MAGNCNDRSYVKHLVGGPGTPYVAHVGGCTAARPPCDAYHPGRPCRVCNSCLKHTQNILRLSPASPWLNVAGQVHGKKNKRYPMNNDTRIGLQSALPFADAMSPPYNLFPAPGPFGLPVPAALQIPTQFAPPSSNPPWAGFLARVCLTCERMIKSEQFYRGPLGYAPGPGAPFQGPDIIATAEENLKWEGMPMSSCTCRYELGMRGAGHPQGPGQRMCYKHREAKLRELEKKKDVNDAWLRKIALDQGALVNAGSVDDALAGGGTQTRKDTRRANGNWRACRCGNELGGPANIEEVFICMACEGWVSPPLLGPSRYDQTWLAVPPLIHYHTLAEVRHFRKYRMHTVKLNRQEV